MSPAAARTAGPHEGEQEGCFVPIAHYRVPKEKARKSLWELRAF